MNLKQAKVLLTGGSLGIGKATAKMLVDAGAKVVITGRNEDRLKEAAEETGAQYVVADVSQPEEVKHTYQQTTQLMGGLDVLINNAGIGGGFSPLSEVTADDFLSVYSVNVMGVAMMSQLAAEIFKKQGHGSIINIGSTAGTKGFERGTVYASSKFALRGMTQCWQAELRKHNIRVMLINPSEVTTAFGNKDREERDEEANKLRSREIAHAITSALQMDDRGFIPELAVWATNPWK
ncbi:SDR family oxidoreductase [Roseivirga sp. BDSF3-8]|uniref:SDR family oxidoreductase n=1 Tax=Roseivirga sp. BDSF3-8 TaxID=3241598 RepID=UPI003531EC81